MPTIIVLDTSVSMGIAGENVSGSQPSKLELVVQGLSTFLDYISSRQRLEFLALLTFSHKCDVLCPFTRDLNAIRDKLSMLTISNTTPSFGRAMAAVEELFVSEWDLTTMCNIIFVTQETCSIPTGYRFELPFPANIMLINVSNGASGESLSMLTHCLPNNVQCKIYYPEAPFIPRSFHFLFFKICEEHFSPWVGTLACGNLNAKVVLSPNPIPFTKTTDFDQYYYSIDPVIEICGFVEMKYLGSPGCVSRHLVFPFSTAMTVLPPPVNFQNLSKHEHSSHIMSGSSSQFGVEIKMEEEENAGEGHLPNFCVLLHGALKVENMAALCFVGKEWYGLLYSWADSKKKSNLMLSLLEPGPDAVPWLGNLNHLTLAFTSEEIALCEKLPIKPVSKRVSPPNPSSWIRQSGLQADIQKVLRHARKLPDKTVQFFKELNRVRKAALSIGFVQLLEGLAAILERECTSLPGSAHPACALQLSHAASLLKEPNSMDIRYNMMPMKMSF